MIASDKTYTIELTGEQIHTIILALKLDYKGLKDLGDLPIADEMRNDIMNVYKAIRKQTRNQNATQLTTE